MEWKLPCVGSDAGAMREVILDGKTGRVVPVGDASALAGTLLELLRRPEGLREMGERGREYVRSRFPWSHVARLADGPLRRAIQPVLVR